jgi:hypothetical protein
VSEFVDVEAVRVLDGYRLELTFSTGEVRELDVERYLWGPAFEPLRDPAEFTKVAVDPELGTIVWPNGADLSPEELYAQSTPAPTSRAVPDTTAAGGQQAQLRAAHRAQLLATECPTLTELAARRGDSDVGVTGAWAAARVLARELIVLNAPDDNLVVPAFQLTPAGDPRPELRPLLAELRAGRVSGWESWTWLTSPSSYLSGEVPEQAAVTDPARAAQAAARFAASSGGPIRVDLSRFTTAGFGTVHGAAVDGLRVGEIVTVADEDSDELRAEVVAIRPEAADLRVSWDRRLAAGDPAVPVVRIELGPVQRDLHLVELTDVDLESGPLAVGDRLELVDEGGYRYRAVVQAVEPGRYGNRYGVRFSLVTGGTLDTKGGPRTNTEGQVLDDTGSPIPGLYGVGNCVASPSAQAYWAGGATLGPILALAHRAATAAHAERVAEPQPVS